MRITFILPEVAFGGGVRVVAAHAQRLQRRGHTVLVVSLPPARPNLRKWLREIAKGRLPRWKGARASHLDQAAVPRRILARRRAVRDGDVPDADVVVATWWETAEWVHALSPRKGAKAYLLQGFDAHPWLPVERVRATWRLPLHKVVVEEWLAELARRAYGDPCVSVVPNAVDLEIFHAPPRGKQERPTVGLAYSPLHCKGCDVSLAAYQLARRRIPGLQLVAFGEGHPVAEVPLPGGSRYFRRPASHELVGLYSSCDAWLFGSRSEGFGLPILEAMACRTPVVGTPAGAAPRLIAEGGGLLVRPEAPKAMAAAIERIARLDEPHWRALSDAALATATSYSWDEAALRLERALELAIERTRRGELRASG
jgi:glycosyltransferase involved in cell wall biosynthesis